jgi:hypothetical protein
VNVQDILLKYNRHTAGKVLEVDEDVFNVCRELKEVRMQIDEIEGRKEALEESIKMAFGDAEAISYGGNTLATWKAPKPSTKFAVKEFICDEPEMAAHYMRDVQGPRRFLLK